MGILPGRPIDWPDLRQEQPEQLDYRQQAFEPMAHQRDALNDVVTGFQDSDRAN